MAHTGCSNDKPTSGKDTTEQTPSKELRQPDKGRSADCDNDKKSAHCISNEEHIRGQAIGATCTSDDMSNSSDLTEADSDADYDRSRLLPEHYVAPRRQRRLPHSIRARLASVHRRRLSFNGYDGESNNQEVMSENSDLQLSDDVGSLDAQSCHPEPRLANENARRRLFDSDSKSLRTSFYTIIQSHYNARLSNNIHVATIQSILDAVFGSTRNDNRCLKQSRSPHNTSFSDDDDDLASSDEDCNDAHGSSNNDSPDPSSEEEYVGSTAETVYCLPKSQLSVFDSDLHRTSLYLVASEDSDNLRNCATEYSDTDNDHPTLYNSADEGCNNVNESEEDAFTDLTSSEGNSRSPAADSMPFSPVTNNHGRNVRVSAEDDSDAEYNRQRFCPERCAAPRRQRRLPAFRRSRPSPLSRRRLCFDDSDDESSNQRAVSEDTSVVSQSDASNRTSLLSPSNKYLYALDLPHDYLQQSRHVNVASILSILNDVFDPPSCDNSSPIQFNVSNNSSSEHEAYQSVYQTSLATESPALSTNDSHDSSEVSKQTESPLHPPSPGNSDDSLC